MERDVLRSIHQILAALRNKCPHEDILHLILESACSLANAVHGSFITINHSSQCLYITSTYGPDWGEEHISCNLKIGEGLTGRVAESGQAILCNDVTKEPGYYSLFDRVRSELVVPVFVEEQVWGLINLDGMTTNAFDNQTMETIGVMAELAASAITLRIDLDRESALQVELKRARDAAVESTRLKSEFLANMSHEIRTPMNGVLGMITLLQETEMNDRQRHFVTTARSSAESLLTILNEVLDFSKIEAGKIDLEIVEFDLAEVVQTAVEIMAERAHSKNLELNSFINPSLPTLMFGDPTRVRQVLLNLINNAIKFTDKGGVVLRIDKVAEEEKSIALTFSVIDTGIGIPLAARDRLFQAFSQADGSTTRKYGGTGLGLVISKRLVELMGGKISFSSEEGQGSSFWFTVRFGKVPADTICRLEANLLQGTRLLMVDPSPVVRDILSKHAAHWRMDFETAPDGTTALETLRKRAALGRPMEILLLDTQMQEPDSLAIASLIKNDSTIAGVKIVMLSSLGKSASPERLQQAGAATVLFKPVRKAQLYDCLAALQANRPLLDTSASIAQKSTHSPLHAAIKLRILVVDDSDTNQQVAMFFLQGFGHTVKTASSGQQALNELSQSEYDLVFMDVQMPGMDGLKATQMIRGGAASARCANIPIVAMTAHAMAGDRERCLRSGMDDYVTKPIVLPELQAAIHRVQRLLEERHARGTATVASCASPPKPDLEQLTIMPKFPPELVNVFFSETKRRLVDLKRAVETKSAPSIQHIAHTMRGTASTFGVKRFTEICRVMEQQAYAGELAKMPLQVEEMETLLTSAETIYRQQKN